MTDISEKFLHEIYKEDASELINDFDKREALTSIIPVEYSGKLEKFLFSSTTNKPSIEKLQEKLNTAKKYIEHVIGTIKYDGHLGTIQTDQVLPDLEKALTEIGRDND